MIMSSDSKGDGIMIAKSVPDVSVNISNALDRPETMFALRLFRSLNPADRMNLLELAEILVQFQSVSPDLPTTVEKKPG